MCDHTEAQSTLDAGRAFDVACLQCEHSRSQQVPNNRFHLFSFAPACPVWIKPQILLFGPRETRRSGPVLWIHHIDLTLYRSYVVRRLSLVIALFCREPCGSHWSYILQRQVSEAQNTSGIQYSHVHHQVWHDVIPPPTPPLSTPRPLTPRFVTRILIAFVQKQDLRIRDDILVEISCRTPPQRLRINASEILITIRKLLQNKVKKTKHMCLRETSSEQMSKRPAFERRTVTRGNTTLRCVGRMHAARHLETLGIQDTDADCVSTKMNQMFLVHFSPQRREHVLESGAADRTAHTTVHRIHHKTGDTVGVNEKMLREAPTAERCESLTARRRRRRRRHPGGTRFEFVLSNSAGSFTGSRC